MARSLNRLSTTPDAQSLNTLAIAQAETGDFSAAKQTVRQALALARQADNERAIGLLTRQLRLIDDRRKPSEGLR
jgi:Flp pilus assembly protein TadD